MVPMNFAGAVPVGRPLRLLKAVTVPLFPALRLRLPLRLLLLLLHHGPPLLRLHRLLLLKRQK